MRFIQANSMFDGMKKKAKKTGRGVCKPYKQIVDSDMTTLGQYFVQDFDQPPVNS